MAEPQKKRTKREGKNDDNDEEQSNKLSLHLKSLFAKRPWYFGGKILFSRDGSTSYCAHEGGLAVVHDLSTITQVLVPGDDVTAFAIASGPETVATCSRRGLVRIFNPSLEELRNFNSLHTGPVSEMDIDPTGECLATGSADFSVRVFSVSGGYPTHNFRGHRGIISAVKFHPNEGNLTLATADVTGVISLWDLRTKKNVWLRNHMGCVPSIAFLGVNLLVSVGRDRVLNVWSKDSSNAPLKTVPTFESMESVIGIDNSQFITGGADGSLKRWKFDQKKSECINVETIERIVGGDSVVQLSAIQTEKQTTTLVTVSQTECILSFRNMRDLSKISRGTVVGFDDEIYDLTFLESNSWRRVAIATNSALVRIYNFDDLGLTQSVDLLTGHDGSVLSIASSGGDRLLTGSKDQTARLWDATSLKCLGECKGHTDAVTTVATCNKPGNPFFATGSDDCSIRLWSFDENAKSVLALDHKPAHSKAVLDICFSPNDELLASASADRTCKLWKIVDMKKGKYQLTGPTLELKGHRRAVNSVRFSSMDKVCCTASADTTVKVWSIVSGACVRTLQSHTSPVTCAVFMSSGTHLVTSGSDGTIKAWDLKSSSCVQTLFGKNDGGHESRIWSLGLVKDEHDEQYVTSVGIDGVITVWRDATKEERDKRMQLEKAEILNREALDRSIAEKRYLEAAKLALKLDRPHQLRQILESVPVEEIQRFVQAVLKDAESARVAAFLVAVTSWNTLSRTSMVAQRTISACVDMGSELEKQVGKRSFAKFLSAAAPYTERHFARVDRLLKASYLLDRVLENASLV